MPFLPEAEVKSFRGPNLILPCPSSMLELDDIDWPLLEDAKKRAALTQNLCEALRLRGRDPSWERLAGDQDLGAQEYLGNLIALTAIGLQARVGRCVSRSLVIAKPGPPARALVAWEHFFPLEGRSAGRRALELLGACANKRLGKAKLAAEAEAAVEGLREDLPDPVADVIMEGLAARRLPWRVFDNQWPIFEVGTGCRRQRLMTSMPESQSHIDRNVFRNKYLAAAILREAGLPMPRHELVASAEQARAAAERTGYPVVVKPVDSGRSRGVTVNITDPDAIPEAFDFASGYGSAVLVERFIPGLPYRILIIDGEVIAVALRGVPGVTGDGVHSVDQLVALENARRREENLELSQPLPLINIPAFEAECRRRLVEQGLALDAVPEAGREVWLAHHAQRGRGGLNIDVTAEVHPDHFELAAHISEIMRCPAIGIDFITEDIRRSYREVACGINEVNIEPALNLHMRMTRTPRDVVGPFLETMFPGEDDGRVPLLAVLGAAVAPLEPLCRALERSGRRVGFAARDGGTTLGGAAPLARIDADRRLESLLFDPRAESLVFELNEADFARGLPFDRCSAALFLLPSGRSFEGDFMAAVRLLKDLTAGPLILPLESAAFWRRHVGDLHSRAILFSETEALDLESLTGVMAEGHKVVGRARAAPDGAFVFYDGVADRLLGLDGVPDAERSGWLLAAAGLLGLGDTPDDVRRCLDEALETAG